jgi:hypothetical protein
MEHPVSYQRLIWRRFRRTGSAWWADRDGVDLCVALFVEVLAPHTPQSYEATDVFHPPQQIYWTHDGAFAPHVLGHTATIDYNSGQRIFTEDPDDIIRLGLWVRGTVMNSGAYSKVTGICSGPSIPKIASIWSARTALAAMF